ncbi:MAG: PAS domain S-box protein [Blastocatellia bacterium]
MMSQADDLTTQLRQEVAELRARLHQLEAERRHDEALRRSEVPLRQMAENIREMIFLVEADGSRVHYVNPAYEQITGCTCASIYEKPESWLDAVHPDDLGRVREAYEGLKQGDQGFTLEYRIVRPDGSIRWIWDRTFPISDETGQVRRLAGVAEDITDRKKAEAELRKSEMLFRAVAETAPCSIIIYRGDEICYVNAASTEISGYSREELLRMTPWQIIHPDQQEMVRTRAHLRPQQQLPPTSEEERIVTRQGEERWIEVFATVIPDYEGRPAGLAIALDTTERRRVEAQNKDSREQLRQFAARIEGAREEERKAIAREVHDELAQSLTALRFDLWWLDHRLASLPGEEISQCRERSADMIGIVDQTIKAVQRIATSLRPSILDDLGLVAAVEWLVQDFQARTSISLRLNSEFDDASLDHASATALFRILQESLTNISRHAGATEATISLKEEAGHLVLEISDNGRGITADEINNTRSLGLPGMRERALLLGGDLSVTGRDQAGTTVQVRLPLRRTSSPE